MNLPEDIVLEILSWLPAKSLIRFKCVCQSWHALLGDQSFISKHTKNMAKSINSAHLLITCRNNTTNKTIISMSRDSSLEEFIGQELPPSFRDNFGRVRLVGPCNGIVCLYGYPDHIALCNPSIGEFRILPVSQIPRPDDGKVRGGDVGLGFDSETNNYKVIQILFCVSKHGGCEYQVEIYSLNANSWKKYDAIPANVMHTNLWSAAYKNGTFCWWVQRGDDDDDDQAEVILSFDMTLEAFQETPLPPDVEALGGDKRTTRAILPLDDSIAVVVYRIKEIEKFFEVWMVNQLGPEVEKSSWIKLWRIGPVSGVERPLGFWKNGEFILESCSRELVLFDPENKRLKHLGLFGKRDRLEVLVYYESLVSLHNVSVS